MVGQFWQPERSAFHQHDSNGPKIVSNGALYPRFWTSQNFNFLCLCSTQNQHFSAVFHFLVVLRPNGLARAPQTLTFQYRTPRSRLVIPPPRDFWAESLILTQLFGEFQGSVFPVPKISLDIRTFKILKVLISSLTQVFGTGKAAPWNSPKSGSKIRFRPKHREEKELRGENGAFDTETSGFGGDVRVRSA